MKKFLSMILAIVMIISVLPVSVFATEEVAAPTEVSNEVNEIPKNYGTEVALGGDIYYIEDGCLLFSSNNGRPKTINNDVTWVIEENGNVYYSKLGEHNTTDIVKYDPTTGEESVLVHLFVPVEAFDVAGDEVYYLYNGEINKINVVTNEQAFVMIDRNMNGFYLDEDGYIHAVECQSEKESEVEELIELQNVTLVEKSFKATSAAFSRTDIVGNKDIIFYDKNGIGKKILTIDKDTKVKFLITADFYTQGNKKEEWINVNWNGEFFYVKKKDIADSFWSTIELLFSGELSASYFSSHNAIYSADKYSIKEYSTYTSAGQGDYEINPNLNESEKKEAENIPVKDEPSWVSKTWGKIKSFFGNLFGKSSGSVSLFADSSSVVQVAGTVTNSEGQWYMLADSTYVSKPQFDKYYLKKGSSSQSYNSSITISSTSHPIGNIIKGNGYGLRGTIKSALNISSVTGQIISASTGKVWSEITVYPNAREYNITANALLNTKLTFGILAEGAYYLKYTARDVAGGTQTWQSGNFNVVTNGTKISPMPNISVETVEHGQRVTISCDSSSTMIHYTVNGSAEKSSYGTMTQEFTTAGTYNISAWTTKSGCTTSVYANKSVSVSKAVTPQISEVNYGLNEGWVTVSGGDSVYYTTNGSTPTKGSSFYNGAIYFNKNSRSMTLKAISTQYGYQNSDVAEKYLNLTAPDAVKITLQNTKTKIAQGKTATVRWDPSARAAGYVASLYYEGTWVKDYETSGTTASFALPEVGTYTIKVRAKNFKGDSAESNSVTIQSMAPVTVTFVDKIWRDDKVTDSVVQQIQENINTKYEKEGKDNPPKIEGNVLSVQKIDYDSVASKPLWEDRHGFTHAHFSDEAALPVTQDTTFYAYYYVKSYTVEFWNHHRYYAEENRRIGDVQNILYSFSATAPTNVIEPEGYTLAGWNVDSDVSDCYDFTFVEGNMKLDTVYAWENKDLPVILDIVSAKRGNTCQSYDVNLKYIHYNEMDTQARIIVTLYTLDGKVVDVGVKDVDLMLLQPGEYYTDTVTVNYPNQVAKISAVMVYVDEDRTGGAVSKMKYTTNIEMPNDDWYWDKWSSWSTTEPSSKVGVKKDANGLEIQGIERDRQSKPQYRYRERKYTTSSASSLSGWTKYDTKRTSWSGTQGPVYSNPSNGSRNVWSESYITSSNYKTVYRYYRYANSTCATWGSSYPDYAHYYEWEFDYPLELKAGTSYSYKLWCGCGVSGGYHTVYSVNWQGHGDYPASKWVSYNYGTRWYYQEPVYTYYYYKWGNWSSWQDTQVTETNDIDVDEPRTVWRYRDKFSYYPGYDPSRDDQTMEETIKKYPMSGNISGLEKDYNGKVATILVYKKTNTDPTANQLEYVDQTTLGENNSYSFTINPKHEIDYYTGDYVVTLSIEGCEKLATIGIIEAPVPQYTVTFQNDDGTMLIDGNGDEIKPIKIDKGGSIDVNGIPIPQKEGHRFLKWDTSLIDVNGDITVSPIYEKELYNVVFIDYENKTAEMSEFHYGDAVTLPDAKPIDGKRFVGWDIKNYKYATEENVDADIYNIKSEELYYLTTDGEPILVEEYNSEKHNVIDTTQYDEVYYLTEEGFYILAFTYDPEVHNIVDKTLYYKYVSESKTVITESKIITAIWDDIKYKVTFCDFNGNILSEQFVAHGKAAIPPAGVEKDGVIYNWDLTGDEWWNVTSDMMIYPYVPVKAELDAPTINASTNIDYGMFTAELETTAENAKVYYTYEQELTDDDVKMFADNLLIKNEMGEDAEIVSLSSTTIEETAEYEEGDEIITGTTEDVEETEEQTRMRMVFESIIEYEEPIDLWAGSVVYAFAVDENGNFSPISVFQYEFNNDAEDEGIVPNEFIVSEDAAQIRIPTIEATLGETVTIPVEIKNNPGLTNLSLLLGYDTESLTLDSVENGDVFADGKFSYDTREDGSCKFVWETAEVNTTDGILMNLTFSVDSDVKKEDLLLDIMIDYNDETTEEEQLIITVPGTIATVSQGMIGDVNGDEEVDFADAILLLKYDVGLSSIDEERLFLGDVNGDGEVDFADAILVLKFDVGLIDEFTN